MVIKYGNEQICLYGSTRIIKIVAGICNCETELLATCRSDTCPYNGRTNFLNQIYRIIEKIITDFIKQQEVLYYMKFSGQLV
jgi:hypothetical protein